MTSFQPPYLAEEIVLLPQHLYLGLLPGDDLVLGQVAGPRPAGLVGEGPPRLRLVEPIVGRLHRGFPADDPPRDVVGVEYLERALASSTRISMKEDAYLVAFSVTDFA